MNPAFQRVCSVYSNSVYDNYLSTNTVNTGTHLKSRKMLTAAVIGKLTFPKHLIYLQIGFREVVKKESRYFTGRLREHPQRVFLETCDVFVF